MSTEKLFYKDAYLKEFDAVVLSCEEAKKGWKIVLDKTAFYPEGGGQPTDKGVLTYDDVTVNVSEVHEKAEIITHTTDAPIAVGTTVHGTIDWDRRYDFMQQHTGDHMISGVILSEYGFSNVGFHLTEKELAIDYDGTLTDDDIAHITQVLNENIWAGKSVTASYPENVKEMNYRSKVEIEGDIRIVEIDGVDVCACCGTHLSNTAQVGMIFIYATQSFNGGTRVFAVCGKRALDMMKKRNSDCYEISHLLSSPVDKITDGVNKRLKDIEEMKISVSAMKRQMMSSVARSTETDGEIAVAVTDGFDSQDIANLAILLNEKAKTAIACSGGKICIVSQTQDTNKLGRFIRQSVGGKGGGKPGIYQGIVSTILTRDELLSLYREYTKM